MKMALSLLSDPAHKKKSQSVPASRNLQKGVFDFKLVYLWIGNRTLFSPCFIENDNCAKSFSLVDVDKINLPLC